MGLQGSNPKFNENQQYSPTCFVCEDRQTFLLPARLTLSGGGDREEQAGKDCSDKRFGD
jgi:hypothetical protein